MILLPSLSLFSGGLLFGVVASSSFKMPDMKGGASLFCKCDIWTGGMQREKITTSNNVLFVRASKARFLWRLLRLAKKSICVFFRREGLEKIARKLHAHLHMGSFRQCTRKAETFTILKGGITFTITFFPPFQLLNTFFCPGAPRTSLDWRDSPHFSVARSE